jgi:hypothetical protein
VSVEGDCDSSSPRELVGIKGGVFFALMYLWALNSCTTDLLTEPEEMGTTLPALQAALEPVQSLGARPSPNF